MSDQVTCPEQQINPNANFVVRLIKLDGCGADDLVCATMFGQESVLHTQFGDILARQITESSADLRMQVVAGVYLETQPESELGTVNSPISLFRTGDFFIGLTAIEDDGRIYQSLLVFDQPGQAAYYIANDQQVANLDDREMKDRYASTLYTAREIMGLNEPHAPASKRGSRLGWVAAKLRWINWY